MSKRMNVLFGLLLMGGVLVGQQYDATLFVHQRQWDAIITAVEPWGIVDSIAGPVSYNVIDSLQTRDKGLVEAFAVRFNRLDYAEKNGLYCLNLNNSERHIEVFSDDQLIFKKATLLEIDLSRKFGLGLEHQFVLSPLPGWLMAAGLDVSSYINPTDERYGLVNLRLKAGKVFALLGRQCQVMMGYANGISVPPYLDLRNPFASGDHVDDLLTLSGAIQHRPGPRFLTAWGVEVYLLGNRKLQDDSRIRAIFRMGFSHNP